MYCRDGFEDGQIILESIAITFALNGALSMGSKQYHRLLLKRSEVPLTQKTYQGCF